MNRIIVIVLATLFVHCGKQDLQTGDAFKQGDAIEISGTLVDTRCFAENTNNIGNDHDRSEGHIQACGTACARLGFPVAVVTGGLKDGKVWVLLTNPQAMADYIAAPVRVSGTVGDNGIVIPERVELKTTSGWTIIL
ncbi:MAG: hypothetical protein HKN43_06455 [Rhodothermales bacterium]|nr:hypothetical protein [Rhodothermales bacterium]